MPPTPEAHHVALGAARSGAVVVCLGDLVEDVVVRPSRELRRGTDTDAHVLRRRGGSAANVAVAVARAGGRARFVGCVGADRAGGELVAALEEEGVDVVVERRGRSGTVVAVLSPDGERSFLTDRGSADDLRALPDGALADVGVLHVPAYSLARGATAATAHRAITAARDAGALISLDASSYAVLEARRGESLGRLRPDVLHANADEAEVLGVGPGRPLEGVGQLVLTAGAGPTTLVDAHGTATEIPVDRLGGVTDTTGAGDAFVGGLLAGILGTRAAGASADLAAATLAGHAAAAAQLRTNTLAGETE
ncbi:MAG: PfkB family carbohydrate kinase [Actinomycetota bacterium]|nr:PfkB family carbohydrate kinase [Actinomycetota bacterium]